MEEVTLKKMQPLTQRGRRAASKGDMEEVTPLIHAGFQDGEDAKGDMEEVIGEHPAV